MEEVGAVESGPALNQSCRIEMSDGSKAGESRRAALGLCALLGLSEVERGAVSIAVTEIATNLIRHAQGGEVLLTAVRHAGSCWLDILGLDRGPGMASVAQCLQDGYSTAGSPGTGLGALRRLADVFDLFSVRGEGTAVLSRFIKKQAPGEKEAAPLMAIGAVNLPMGGASVSGDGWSVEESPGRTVLMMADGTGHGLLASEAARTAEGVFRKRAALGPKDLAEQIHRSLVHTRGAAVAIAEVAHGKNRITYAGIGNITGMVHADGKSRSMVSMNGIAGGPVRAIQDFSYPFAPAANDGPSLILMHSDGIATIPGFDRYPGFVGRHPALIAGVLWRDFGRGRDDASVLVAKTNHPEASPSP